MAGLERERTLPRRFQYILHGVGEPDRARKPHDAGGSLDGMGGAHKRFHAFGRRVPLGVHEAGFQRTGMVFHLDPEKVHHEVSSGPPPSGGRGSGVTGVRWLRGGGRRREPVAGSGAGAGYRC